MRGGVIKHGLYVKAADHPSRRDQRVRRLVFRMRAAMPWLEDSDIPACRGWAELEILSTTKLAELRRGRFAREHGDRGSRQGNRGASRPGPRLMRGRTAIMSALRSSPKYR